MDPRERLRHHVTGAIERGEATPITELPASLDEFTRGYIEAALWSSHGWNEDNPDDTSFLDMGKWIEDLDPDLLRSMIEDCRDFQTAQNPDLFLAYAQDYTYTAERAGHDFWFTRVGHGVGFWSRGLGDIGDRLTDASKPYGSMDLYLEDDGLIYGG